MSLGLLLQIGGFLPVGIFGRDSLGVDPFGHFVGFQHKLLIIERGFEGPTAKGHRVYQFLPFVLHHRFTLLDTGCVVVTATVDKKSRMKMIPAMILAVVAGFRRRVEQIQHRIPDTRCGF